MSIKKPLQSGKATGMPQRKADLSRELTSEHIAAHIEAFRASGGTVEVLGVTRVLKHVDAVPAAATPLPEAG